MNIESYFWRVNAGVFPKIVARKSNLRYGNQVGWMIVDVTVGLPGRQTGTLQMFEVKVAIDLEVGLKTFDHLQIKIV